MTITQITYVILISRSLHTLITMLTTGIGVIHSKLVYI